MTFLRATSQTAPVGVFVRKQITTSFYVWYQSTCCCKLTSMQTALVRHHQPLHLCIVILIPYVTCHNGSIECHTQFIANCLLNTHTIYHEALPHIAFFGSITNISTKYVFNNNCFFLLTWFNFNPIMEK